ncbi:MAG: heavy metal translocating P-type ATPase [Nanoarchaeota archaeon]|jgi:Cu+-exporting ATPase|nr:heavy metal translocating P-type ATPase [Nanoarchaeota archaeon]
MKKVNVEIVGMTCSSCSNHVAKEFEKMGAKNINVNPVTNKAVLEVEDNMPSKMISDAVKTAGYKATAVAVDGEKSTVNGEQSSAVSHQSSEKVGNWKRKLIGVWAFTIPIIILMYLPAIIGKQFISMDWMNILMLILPFPVIFIIGWSTIKSGFLGFFKLRFTMDSLIMLGTTIAFSTGFLSLFLDMDNYSGVSGMIMAIFITGKYIEHVAKGKATKEIKKLLELGAKDATVIRGNNELVIPLAEVKIGDIMIIKPGEKVPTDGIVIKGASYIDESMISGESMPVEKKIGSKVIGATVNQDSILHVKASKIGKDTFLSNIIKLVEEAQGTKVPIQAVADKVTGIFVPAVLVIATLTLFGWLIGTGWDWGVSIGVAISVLVIACPCALGLAVPIALTVGSGIGAKRGILIRKGEAIQTMKEVKIVCFDKTGTITKGKPELSEMYTHTGVKEDYLLKVAASLEKLSEHPLAHAILEKEKTKKYFDVKSFKVVRGKGVVGKIGAKEILVGSEKLFEAKNFSLVKIKDKISAFQEKGMSIMIVTEGKNILGAIGIRDEVKKDSKSAIMDLNKAGYKTVMITGDNQKTAEVIGREVGIKQVIADVLPEDKLNIVMKLQKEGYVAFVGDGINDAPALKQANVGIAVGSGSDIAIEAGDIVLANSDLTSVVKSIRLSKKTFGKIKQNLFWAFFYNAAMIPLAISGHINPVLAELAMAFSSISVVLNANLLRRVKL